MFKETNIFKIKIKTKFLLLNNSGRILINGASTYTPTNKKKLSASF